MKLTPTGAKVPIVIAIIFLLFISVHFYMSTLWKRGIIFNDGIVGSDIARHPLLGMTRFELEQMTNQKRQQSRSNLNLMNKLQNQRCLVISGNPPNLFLQEPSCQILNPLEQPFNYSSENPLLFHTFWRGKVHKMLPLLVKSYIISQPLEITKFIVWTLNDTLKEMEDNEEMKDLINQFPNHVQIREFNVQDYRAGTCLENNKEFDNFLEKCPVVLFSDVVRLCLMNKLGGLWVDADVYILRNVFPLISVAHEFSTHYNTYYGIPHFNNHVLHVARGSNTGKALVTSMCKLIKPRIPVAPLRPDWQLNDGAILYCNQFFKCNVTAVDGVFMDPQWKYSTYSCRHHQLNVGTLDKRYRDAYFMHHRMDDCELPPKHYISKMANLIEYWYAKKCLDHDGSIPPKNWIQDYSSLRLQF